MNQESGGEAITAEGLIELEREIADLEGPEREKIAERLKVARALGDLKENAEYHIAKEDQAHLETRIKRLRERLARAVVIEATEDDRDVFSFGSTAEVEDSDGQTHTWTLVGSTEADMSRGMLSAESPIGLALRDRAVDEEVEVVTPAGTRTFRIIKVG